jgi:hypothetical protein
LAHCEDTPAKPDVLENEEPAGNKPPIELSHHVQAEGFLATPQLPTQMIGRRDFGVDGRPAPEGSLQ